MAPSPLNPSHRSPNFTPVQESDEGDDDSKAKTPPAGSRTGKPAAARKRPDPDGAAAEEEDGSVSCNKCRPHAREKISIVPLETKMSMASPNKIFRSIISTLTRKSPRPSEKPPAAAEERWKAAVTELSHKLINATRKRDEALLEASRLKYSMAELEKKLNKLEIYCHTLKSGLEECSNADTTPFPKSQVGVNGDVVENFLVSVSEARSSVRLLSRSLTVQLRHMGGKVHERVSGLLQPYDVRVGSIQKNPRSVLFYLEALLNKTFFEDFESVGFKKSSANPILNPIERCEASYASFSALHALTWDEVLVRGTRHFSEDFSRFCDQKMSEIVAMLGWNRAWPEPLLQAFFGASKSVWLVHLLATSVHPGLPIFRVERSDRFDPVYMEDMGADKAGVLVPSTVRVMVAPGFYVYGNAVKCKVLCRYQNTNSNGNGNGVAERPASP